MVSFLPRHSLRRQGQSLSPFTGEETEAGRSQGQCVESRALVAAVAAASAPSPPGTASPQGTRSPSVDSLEPASDCPPDRVKRHGMKVMLSVSFQLNYFSLHPLSRVDTRGRCVTGIPRRLGLLGASGPGTVGVGTASKTLVCAGLCGWPAVLRAAPEPLLCGSWDSGPGPGFWAPGRRGPG